ncbi:MerR family transcriptional regulator [Turneriella parva]|uniref:Regulatory protein MerR n=1 Tax=Turneriella parva (strain ATCC BAA-1111 / DSM 21527 / NCTC 11395 / H) TaxID=869212 RepID=I4B756_TURPD|nr:MerR family transcriptional regulator [Turneriella parva]AFM13113.1 regulatory protein MerR [Turneriella parva DSM 21527]
MRLTAKKLSELTGVPAANIRKWRERYSILDPQRGDNGYLYYTSEDYRVVLGINRLLADGKKLAGIMHLGRGKLLEIAPQVNYTTEQMQFLEKVIEGNFSVFSQQYDEYLQTHSVESLVQKKVHPQTVLVGQAWESGFITVATEHAFTRWVMGYLSQLALRFTRKKGGDRLFVAFPGDAHELGAMMHFVLMSAEGLGGKFCGALPFDRLFEELNHGDYEEVHVSATIPKSREEIDKFVSAVHKKFPHIKVKIGGSGAKTAGSK